MDKYLEKEKRLAELLEYENVEEFRGILLHSSPIYGNNEPVPQWTRDPEANYRLMVEHHMVPFYTGKTVMVHPRKEGTQPVVAHIVDHPDELTAVMFAVVQAVIVKLEAQNATQTT